MGNSSIEWCTKTWNVITGCTHSGSPGCDHCWAASMVKRFPHLHGIEYGPDVGGDLNPAGIPVPFSEIRFHPSRLDEPLRWRKPQRVFCCSMGDLFHEYVEEEWVDKVIGVTRLTPQHSYMFLTKRPERMISYFADNPGAQMVRVNKEAQKMLKPKNFICPDAPSVWPRHNLMLGVSVESPDYLWRVDHLRQTPAALRFISFEPLIADVGKVDLTGISWCIVGSESGPRRRPCNLGWIRSLRDQCVAANVPFFCKQANINGKLVKMPVIDGKVWGEVPEATDA